MPFSSAVDKLDIIPGFTSRDVFYRPFGSLFSMAFYWSVARTGHAVGVINDWSSII